jgi:hypothetical protein
MSNVIDITKRLAADKARREIMEGFRARMKELQGGPDATEKDRP